AALARVDDFRREHIGTGRSTTRPLPTAIRHLAEAEEALAAARTRQEELRNRAEVALAARSEAAAARVRLARREAAHILAEATRLNHRAAEAEQLALALGGATSAAVPAAASAAAPAAAPGAASAS